MATAMKSDDEKASWSTPLCETKKDHDCTECDADSEIAKKYTDNEALRISVLTCVCVMSAYILGKYEVTSVLPFVLCTYIWWLVKDKVRGMDNLLTHDCERMEHTRRALEHPETVEWLNILLNRWWCFSDRTIDTVMKRALDPTLDSCKPKIIESIEMTKFTLGTRTPYLTYLKLHEMTEDLRFKKAATDIMCRNPPADMGSRKKYQIAIDADMGLDAPDSQLIIGVKLKKKFGYTDIVVNHFKLRGRLQLVLFFNEEIDFPHLTKFSFSFLTVPKVNFGISLLKSIKLMEFSSIKTWLDNLVSDILETSLVDPGHVTVPLCDDPGLLGRQAGYASGVLTLTIQGGENGRATTDTQWCSVTMDKEKIRTKPVTSDNVKWTEQMSFIIRSLLFDKLRIKLKGRRLLGPNYTICEYRLPLIRLKLDQEPHQVEELEDETIPNSNLTVTLNYAALPFFDLSNKVKQESFEKDYLANVTHEKPPKEVAGILFVCVHQGGDLISMDANGSSDPYVMIFANSHQKHVGHVIRETLNPEWDTMTEFFTLDYTQTVITFAVHDSDRSSVLTHILSTGEEDDFMGSCNMPLRAEDWYVFKKPLDLFYKIKGDRRQGIPESLKKVGKLVVSVLFRPVSFVGKDVEENAGRAMAEGEPIHTKRSKIDAHTVESMIRSERGSLTISIIRARNLIGMDVDGLSDPFISIRVGNSTQEKYKSKVIQNTLNPVWKEQVTMAMVQRHEKLTIEMYDKDMFSQERMGMLSFDYNTLLKLGEVQEDGSEGEGGKPQWFTLQEATSGEIQLAFKAVPPVVSDEIEKASFKRARGNSAMNLNEAGGEFTSALKNDSEESDEEDYLVCE